MWSQVRKKHDEGQIFDRSVKQNFLCHMCLYLDQEVVPSSQVRRTEPWKFSMDKRKKKKKKKKKKN